MLQQASRYSALPVRQRAVRSPTRRLCISDAQTHDNLSVYFIRGTSAPGPVPLTLQEALSKGSVHVLETGTVNELKIENTGSEDVFIQAGDIVKGGRQDRVLSMSFVLPPKSGEVPIAAFCVEHGRWSARGAESTTAFASASEAMPSMKAKRAMAEPAPEFTELLLGGDPEGKNYLRSARQSRVWDSVAETQSQLTASLNAPVAADASASSLQLSLENEKLKETQAAYVKALQDAGEREDDIVGYVVAINGRIASADVYPSNGLFRKMWPKQLAAAATEAISVKGDGDASVPVPSPQAAKEFLVAAEAGSAGKEEVVSPFARREVRDAEKAFLVEARRGDGAVVLRSYLAK